MNQVELYHARALVYFIFYYTRRRSLTPLGQSFYTIGTFMSFELFGKPKSPRLFEK